MFIVHRIQITHQFCCRKTRFAVLLLALAVSFSVTGYTGAYARRVGTCRVGELRCQNGDLCIPREKVCDGIRDCDDDGLDEYVCKFRRGFYRNGPKKGAVFQCQFGGVIPLKFLCNGDVNCLDGGDESEICENNSCLPGQFRCAYGACIPDWQMCNGRKNCPDGSDETAEVCQDIQCKNTEFRCRYGACIRKTQICDVKKHCADGSDESEFLCLITRAKMLSKWEKEEESEKVAQVLTTTSTTTAPTAYLGNFDVSSTSKHDASVEKTSVSTENTPEIQNTTPLTEKTSRGNELETVFDHTITNISAPSSSYPINGSTHGNDAASENQKHNHHINDGNEGKNENENQHTDVIPTRTPVKNSKSHDSIIGGVASGPLEAPSETESDKAVDAPPSVTCVLPEIPENADAVISNCRINDKPCADGILETPTGTQIQYECDAGYSLYGPSTITCGEGGKWSLSPPMCEVMLDVRFGLGSIIPKDFKPRCSAITSTKGTMVECIDPSNLSVKSCSELQRPGVEARISCKPYYRPAGDLPLQYEKCTEKGEWSPGAYQQFTCVPDCGLSEVPKTPFIVNGKSIKRGQWPWHVGIYVEHQGNLTYICGGALITENAVLTSAHCVTRHGAVVDPTKFRVFLGKQSISIPDTDPFVQSRQISKIFVEEAFNFRSLDSDIALMALETPAVLSYFVRPVCYPQTSNSFLEEYQLAQGNLGTVLGWGATENQSLSEELRMIELPVISHQDCVDTYRDFFASMTRSTNYCAGYLNGTSLCNGDSGGGQYFKAIVKGATRWYIQGLVSYGVPKEGSKQCSSSHYTVFTRVGRYTDWIVRTLSRENLI